MSIRARPRARVWKIKCWTGDWEQNRRFLSPFSFEFTWTRRVGEVKQILPSPSDVPLRGGGGAGGVGCMGIGGGGHAKLFLTAALAINIQARTKQESGIPTQAESMPSLCFGSWKSAGAPRYSRASSVECRPLSCLTGPAIFTPCQGVRDWLKKNLGHCEQSRKNNTNLSPKHIFHLLAMHQSTTRFFFSTLYIFIHLFAAEAAVIRGWAGEKRCLGTEVTVDSPWSWVWS